MQEMRIYLLNNTKPYHDEDDGYSGDWFNCPVDFEEVREKLGVEHEEQIEIADYELHFDLHSDMPLWEINANCRMVLELEGTPIGNEMKDIQQKWFSSFEEFRRFSYLAASMPDYWKLSFKTSMLSLHNRTILKSLLHHFDCLYMHVQ